MTKLKQTIALLGLLTVSTQALAQWVEATGSAQIRSGNKTEARNIAVKNAVKDALLFAGASVTSVQQVTDGLLTQDQFKVSAHGSIQQIELVDELHSNGIVNVTIRADIIAEERQCYSSDFQKSLAITQFSLINREQAKIGGIYQIGKSFSKKLFSLLQHQGDTIIPRPWFHQKLSLNTSFEQYYGNEYQLIDTIAQSSDSQFVLLGQVTDVSFGEQTSSDYAFWQDKTTERYFSVDITLFNASTKEQIYREQFDTLGDWPFDSRRRVDVNGGKFWRSDYGNEITSMVEQVKNNIEEVINCQSLQGQIMRVKGNQIQFNLGLQHGVAKGQIYTIVHQAHFIDKNGKHLPQFVLSPFEVEVIDVYNRTAVAHSVQDKLLSNIQTTDFVVLKPSEDIDLDFD